MDKLCCDCRPWEYSSKLSQRKPAVYSVHIYSLQKHPLSWVCEEHKRVLEEGRYGYAFELLEKPIKTRIVFNA